MQMRENYYDRHGLLSGFRTINYTWNQAIDPTLMEISIPEHVEPAVVDLAKPSPVLPIQPGIGVGEITLGMPTAAVHGILGQPDWENHGYEHTICYFNHGLEIKLNDSNGVESIVCHKAGAFGMVAQFRAFSGKTPSSIGIGSALANVIEAYGQPDEKTRAVYSGYKYADAQLTFVIDTENNRVDEIHVW